ncbi:MAG: glycosyltransferase [Bacteroidales bacterium]|nr:glycosyltransferase [Bacteroidales bacterium]
MKRVLQINPVIRTTTSTGKIMKEIGAVAQSCGWESYVAYSRGRDGVPADSGNLLPVGSRLSVALHGLLTRLTDRHGLGSRIATRHFIRKVEALDPDVIHIHNIHGYFLNYKILFRYLRRSGKPVIWTVHDCWLYTGHCYHYDSVGCDRWKTVCHDCPQKKEFPTSLLLDRSKRNFKDKRKAFTSLDKDKFTIVTVSEWMRDQMKDSFLKGCRYEVIHNGIDTDRFAPASPDGFISRYNLQGKHILLGVASIWSKEKGLDDFVKLASMLRKDEIIVLVGLTASQAAAMPENILGLPKTSSVEELCGIYSAADTFVNLTWQDNYPTVNMEAIACGTPVVTYDTGGSGESVFEGTGSIVGQGDLDAVLNAARKIEACGRGCYRKHCRAIALEHFDKQECFKKYIELYETMI